MFSLCWKKNRSSLLSFFFDSSTSEPQPTPTATSHSAESPATLSLTHWIHSGLGTRQTLTSAQVWPKAPVSNTLVCVCLVLLSQQLGGSLLSSHIYRSHFETRFLLVLRLVRELKRKTPSVSNPPDLPTHQFRNSLVLLGTKVSLYKGRKAVCVSFRKFGGGG